MSSRNQKSTGKYRDPDLAGAEVAMRRAAERARRRAEETSGAVAVFNDGEIVQEKSAKGASAYKR